MIKRRVTAIILSLAMVFTMTPMMEGQRSYADDSQGAAKAAMVMGADVLAEGINTADAPTVYMADIPWRVIGYGGAKIASSASTMTLISNENLKIAVKFNEDMNAEDANYYGNSILKSEVDAVTKDMFSPGEKAGIVVRTLEKGDFKGKDTDGIAGNAVTDAALWPLSIKEAGAMNEELRKVVYTHEFDPALQGWQNYWWLRSPGSGKWAGAVTNRGEIPAGFTIGFPVDNQYGVRPAFNYSLGSVALTTAATGGKVSGTVGEESLNEVGTNTNNEWKVTVKNGHDSFKVDSVTTCDGKNLNVEYSGATTGDKEYISAIIKDKDGNIIYYGNLKNCASDTSGTVKVNVDGKLDTEDTLYIFNEQLNGDKKTDFSSELKEVAIPEISHSYEWEHIDDATHKGVCTLCGAEKTEEHNYNNEGRCNICNGLCSHSSLNDSYNYNSEWHWKECAYCAIKMDNVEHKFRNEWEADGTQHWHPCEVCGYGKDKENHTWDAGVVTKKPTITATGVRMHTCTVCGKKKTEAIAKLPKKNNTLKIKAKTAKIKQKKLKKKNQKLAVKKVIKFTKKGQGKMTYKLVSANKGKKSFKKYFKINKKTGKVTIKKNKKMKKGTYRVKVRVKASGTATYKPSGWKNVTFKIKIK